LLSVNKETQRAAMEAALSTALALSPNQVFNAVNPGTIACPFSNYVPFFFFHQHIAL